MRRWHTRKLLAAAGAGVLIPAGLAASGLAMAASAATPAAASPAAAAATPATAHGKITTIAGGVGGPAPATSVSVGACALKFANGQLYFGTGESTMVAAYRVSQRTGVLTPVAGSGPGPVSFVEPANGVPAAAFFFSSPCGTTVDPAGNVLVADADQVVAVAAKTGTFFGKKMTAGRVYAVASGFGYPAARDVQFDRYGNLVITVGGSPASHTDSETDSQVYVLAERSGTFYGQKMSKGTLHVIAGELNGGPAPQPMSAAPAAGVRASQVNLGWTIGTLRIDAAGNIILADSAGTSSGPFGGGSTVAPQVRVIPVNSGSFYRQSMRAGYIYTIAGGGTKTPNGVPGTAAALLAARAVALDRSGNILVADDGLRVIAAKSGTFYGKKMIADHIYTLPKPVHVTAVAVDNAGNVLTVTQTRVQMLAGETGRFYGKAVHAGGVYTIAGNGRFSYSGDGGPATSAEFEQPAAVAANRAGTLTAVADNGVYAQAVRVIPRVNGVFFGRSMRAGFVYTVAGNGASSGSTVDGIPGTKAYLAIPGAVAFDRAGNLVISDNGAHRVRVLANASGVYYGQKMTAGYIYTVAGDGTVGLSADGGAARAAALGGPQGVAADKSGNVLLIDNIWQVATGTTVRIRVVAASTSTFYGQPMTAGDIYTVAGAGKPGYSGDGGPGTTAQIQPLAITVDGNGNLVIGDTQRVRVVAASSGTFYGQPMTAGDIYTVAGGGTGTADGTPALSAKITAGPVAVDQAGNLLTGFGNTVWMVAERAGRYYGKAMHAGDVYTVARSVAGYEFLDNCPATRALFDAAGIAVQPGTGNLLIADSGSFRVRSVSR
jgi:hypothetical protein